MSDQPIRILGIVGSLRRQSFNRALIEAAQEVAPEGVTVDMYLLHDIPLYNADVEAEGDPPPVVDFKNAIAEADGVLIATPQYNRSIPGVLKNAIDWASRPARQSVFVDKPVALIGASKGKSATAVSREDLMRVLEACQAKVMPDPQYGLGEAGDYIDTRRGLQDEEARQAVRAVVGALAEHVRSQQPVEAD